MKKHLKVFGIWLCVLVLAGCATAFDKDIENELRRISQTVTQPKPYIDQAIWPKTTKDKVYTACLTALHMEGFDIHPMGTSKESGIIAPNKVAFYFKGYTRNLMGFYKLQILVMEVQDNKVMVNINVKANWKKVNPEVWGYNVQDMQNRVNNRLAEDLEKFFARMDILLGKAEYYRGDKVLEW